MLDPPWFCGGGRDGFGGLLPWLVRGGGGGGRVGFGSIGSPRWFLEGDAIANVNKTLEGAGKSTLDLKMQRTST